MPHMEGIFINGEKVKFHPEDILDTDASQYTEEIGESVTAYLGEHLTNPTNPPIDTSLTIAGATADAKKTGDKISELKEDTTQLKSELTAVNENLYENSEAVYNLNVQSQETTVSGWRLNETDGLSSSNASYKLVKYSVTAGSLLKVVSDDRFQFQTVASVPSTGSNNRVGETYGSGSFYVVVPIGATYLIISTPVSDSFASVYQPVSKADVLANELHNLVPEIIEINWESGRINDQGGDQTSETYVRTSGYIGIDDFDYIHLAEKCQIEVFFYNSSDALVGRKIYGSSSTPAQYIYPNRYSGTAKIRIVQYMHNTSWSTTTSYASNDIKISVVSHILEAIEKVDYVTSELGIRSKIVTVAANSYHSADEQKDKIYIGNTNQGSCFVSVISKNNAIVPAQLWGYRADNSGLSIVSFYTDGKHTGFVVAADIVAFGITVSNTTSTTDQYTFIIESLDALTVDVAKNKYITKVFNARHINGFNGTPLSLLHFSDLHEDKVVLARLKATIHELNVTIDDAICTGDMNTDVAGQITSWWDENIMTCIGNHDCASRSGDVYDWTALSMANRDAYYIAPFESNWDITHTSGTSYYYKDYDDAKVRLIVMDGMLYMSDSTASEATSQTTWLANLLSDAITNNLHVLIAIHAPHGGATAVDCSFSKYGQGTMPTYVDCNTPQTVIDTVASAISNGLHFVGYIVGHTHQDNVYDATGDGSQLMYCVTCAAVGEPNMWKNSDQDRRAILDAYNIVTVDTANTLVKIVRGGGADIDDHMRTRKAICFNYSTGEKVGEVL